MVTIEKELKYDIVNVALFELGQQFVEVHEYKNMMDENKDFKEMKTIF